jgi:pimeloyl-ACP methyl ester carboxylesterase
MKKNNVLILFLIFFNLSFSKGIVSTKETIVSEKFVLVGEYVAAEGNNPTIILLHGLGSVRQEWDKMTKILVEKGFGYFSFDLRGHGESNRTIDGKQVSVDNFKETGFGSEWNKMVDDLGVVIKFLTKKGVKEENIILCGASLGANISLLYASKNPKIRKIILLSPGWEYVGLKTENAAKIVSRNKTKLLFASSPLDYYSYSSTRQLIKIVKSYGSEVTFLEGKNSQHGVQMFENEFLKKIILWMREN